MYYFPFEFSHLSHIFDYIEVIKLFIFTMTWQNILTSQIVVLILVVAFLNTVEKILHHLAFSDRPNFAS